MARVWCVRGRPNTGNPRADDVLKDLNFLDFSGTYLDLCGPIWTYLGLFGPIWTYLDNFGPMWTYLDQFWIYLDLFDLFGPLWTYLNLFGFIWSYLDLFGPIWPRRVQELRYVECLVGSAGRCFVGVACLMLRR